MWQALAPKPPESKVRLVGLSAYWPYCHIGAQREIFSETGDSCRDSWGRFCRGPHLHKHSRPSCPADTSVPPPMEAPYGRKWGDLWDLKSDQKVLFGYTTYMDSCFQLAASCLFFLIFLFHVFSPPGVGHDQDRPVPGLVRRSWQFTTLQRWTLHTILCHWGKNNEYQFQDSCCF